MANVRSLQLMTKTDPIYEQMTETTAYFPTKMDTLYPQMAKIKLAGHKQHKYSKEQTNLANKKTTIILIYNTTYFLSPPNFQQKQKNIV